MEEKCWKKVREMAFKKYLKITKEAMKGDDEFDFAKLENFDKTDVELLSGFKLI